MIEAVIPQDNSRSHYTRNDVNSQHVSAASVAPGGAEPTRRNSQRTVDEAGTHEPGVAQKQDSVQISQEAREVAELAARDREVRAHEAAHAAAGGQFAGSPSLTYTKGPDGRSYATGGEVSIDVSPVSGDPQATIDKAQLVRAAALAPAQPSAQDMRVASRASAMAANARAELAAQKRDGAVNDDAKGAGADSQPSPSLHVLSESASPAPVTHRYVQTRV